MNLNFEEKKVRKKYVVLPEELQVKMKKAMKKVKLKINKNTEGDFIRKLIEAGCDHILKEAK